MTTIPASQIDQVTPSVIAAGGSALDVIGLILSNGTRTPIGKVLSFPDATAVGKYYGSGSTEAGIANNYFPGFVGADKLPAAILFAQYNQTAVAAYLRGGASGLTVAAMQLLTGSLTVVMDGYSHVISSISLASYNSFSAAAAGIQAAFTDPTEASFTAAIGASGLGTGASTVLTMASTSGLISVGDAVGGDVGVPAGTVIVSYGTGTGGNGTYNTNHAITSSGAPLTISSNVLNVTVDTDHSIAVGQTVTGSGVAAGTLVTAQIAGTPGGIGTYSISGSPQQVASESMTGVATAPLVTYDSVSGGFVVTSGITGTPSSAAYATGTLAAPLFLTLATGAVLSQGAAAAVPATFMTGVVAQTTDWVTFMTAFDPDNGSGNTVKQAFAAWKNTQNNRYAYVCWDLDLTPSASVPAMSSLGYVLSQNGDSGTCLIGQDAGDAATGSPMAVAAFICGSAASIDFEETNGRITFAFKAQAGLAPTVTDGTAAANLGGSPQTSGRGNGYNFYGAYAAANAGFTWFQRGLVTGPYLWLDSYIDQIQLNAQLQLALLTLQQNAKSIPYSTSGDALIEQALADPIAAGLNFGSFGPGNIDASQAAQVNNAAGANVSDTLQTQGSYLQVLPASSASRQARTTPPAKFWYLDRGSVQSINLSSVVLL